MNGQANDPLAEARRLAGEHGFRIAEVTQYRNPASILDRQPYTAFVLYRKVCRHPTECRCAGVRIGRRTEPSALLRLLRDQLELMKGARA